MKWTLLNKRYKRSLEKTNAILALSGRDAPQIYSHIKVAEMSARPNFIVWITGSLQRVNIRS